MEQKMVDSLKESISAREKQFALLKELCGKAKMLHFRMGDFNGVFSVMMR